MGDSDNLKLFEFVRCVAYLVAVEEKKKRGKRRKGGGREMYGRNIYLFGENRKGIGYGIYQYITQHGKVCGDSIQTQTHRSKNAVDNLNFARAIHSDGFCLRCKSLDWTVLQEHHIDKEKMPNYTITLCANCHQKLHYYKGGWGRKWS